MGRELQFEYAINDEAERVDRQFDAFDGEPRLLIVMARQRYSAERAWRLRSELIESHKRVLPNVTVTSEHEKSGFSGVSEPENSTEIRV